MHFRVVLDCVWSFNRLWSIKYALLLPMGNFCHRYLLLISAEINYYGWYASSGSIHQGKHAEMALLVTFFSETIMNSDPVATVSHFFLAPSNARSMDADGCTPLDGSAPPIMSSEAAPEVTSLCRSFLVFLILNSQHVGGCTSLPASTTASATTGASITHRAGATDFHHYEACICIFSSEHYIVIGRSTFGRTASRPRSRGEIPSRKIY